MTLELSEWMIWYVLGVVFMFVFIEHNNSKMIIPWTWPVMIFISVLWPVTLTVMLVVMLVEKGNK